MENSPKLAENAAFTNVPIEVSVSVGRARPSVRDLLKLEQNSLLVLDKRLDDPVELYVGDRLIAVGVLELDDAAGETPQLMVRLTEVMALDAPTS